MSVRIKFFGHVAHLWRAWEWPEQRIRESQLALLRERVAQTSAEVPYFRDTWAKLGLEAGQLKSLDELRRFPILTKEAIKANFPDGMVSEVFPWNSLYSMATAGTTDRVMVLHEETKRDWDRAADFFMELRGNRFRPGHRSLELPPDACYEHCGADGRGQVVSTWDLLKSLPGTSQSDRHRVLRRARSAFFRDYVWRLRMLPSLGPAGTGAPRELVNDYLATIRQWKPRVLRGLPMTLLVLAKEAAAQRMTFRGLRAVRPNGGKFTPVMARQVEAAFRAPVRENYGTGELGTVAFDCAETRQQHLLGELFYIEFVRNGQPVAPGELGEMLITDLRSRATPLIRYAVGDIGRYFIGRCACGFEGLRFVVESRLTETIVTPGGRAFGGAEILDHFLDHPAIDYARLIQQDDTAFLLEAVLRPKVTQPPDQSALSASFSHLLGHEVTVKLRFVKHIAPERSGKYRLVLSTSHHRFHEAALNVSS